ncbi:MAG: phosphate acetyltransferase [Microcystaceae cyanobacterium]
MTNSLYISTTESGSGKALIALGILEIILQKTTKVGFFRPIISDPIEDNLDEDIELIRQHFSLEQTYEMSFGLQESEVAELLSHHHFDYVLEKIIAQYKSLEQICDFIVCEGSDYLGENSAFEFDLNAEIAKNLGCPILILGNAYQRTIEDALHPVSLSHETFKDKDCPILGIILNKATPENSLLLRTTLFANYAQDNYVLAVIPYDERLSSPRIKDIAEQLNAEVLYGHGRLDSLATNTVITAMQMQHALEWLKDDSLIITPGDRGDMIIGAMQAHYSANYPYLSGIILSGGYYPEPAIARLIEGLPDPLPVLLVKTDTFTTATHIKAVHSTITAQDRQKIALSVECFHKNIDLAALESQLTNITPKGITPKMFLYNLEQQAKADKRHIILPEATDPRILQATAILLEKDVVNLTLLGKPIEVENAIRKAGIQLDREKLKVINPVDDPKYEEYVHSFYELRKHKGVTLEVAHDCVMDVSYFGTMMVHHGDADGMVSGAIHTTQHTIRPALQVIKTKVGFSLVSSIFFMCLGDHILVYGDCAVNPDPNPEQLAEIAISSAETAQTFGINPKVALLSYSSGSSGKGADVEKVREATKIAQNRRPDLAIEGPIQYDAAVDQTVAAQKMPESTVAGQATVLVFPDLNTGNNTYKAVQRETGAIAIGPILQGLKKPVNDLSRGCLVEDIINTVVITAIQSQKT